MAPKLLDLKLLANIVAKLGNIVDKQVKFDMFANNVARFGHIFRYAMLGLS